ncbi:MAG TPA: LPS assembly lipoprotein LptE [Opitutus sp.]|nr:LPS assembly lipoprotein LptE [Opitutus sp.]
MKSDLRSGKGFPPLRDGMRLRLSVIWFICAIIGLAGCAQYQLGTSANVAFTTLYVEPVDSHTLLPQARAIVSTQLREAFARDGRVTLVSSAEAADATLQVMLRDYRREVASALESDTGLARKFTLTLEVACTLKSRAGEDLFTDRIIQVQRDAFTDGGQLQSEYQTVPLLAEALSKKVVHAVLDVW